MRQLLRRLSPPIPSRLGNPKEYLTALFLMLVAVVLYSTIASVGEIRYLLYFSVIGLSAVMAGFWPTMAAIGVRFILELPLSADLSTSGAFEALRVNFHSNSGFLEIGFLICLSVEIVHHYRRSSTQLQKILDNLFSYVALLDTKGVVLEMNMAPLVQGGYRKEDVIGKYFYDGPWWSYDSAVRVRLIEAIKSASQGQTQRYDVVVQMGNELVPIDFQISPVRDENGAIVGLLPTAVDISARKKAEVISKRHNVVIDTARDGFWVVDMAGNLLEANKSYASMSGYSVEELENMHVSQLEAKESADEVKAHIAKIMAQGYDLFETRHCHKDGNVFDVEVSVNYDRNSQEFFAFFRDITERKKAEESLRIAAATFETHEAIMVTDASANILRVNQAFQVITGFSEEEVIGNNPRILSSGRHDDRFYAQLWQELINSGKWEGEMWDRRKNGEIYPKWLTITALKNNQDQITEFVGIFSDISERKKAEEEIYNLAFFDALTKLPNRRLLMNRFQLALSASARNDLYGAVIYLDLDNFKTLNDTLGHSYGDLLLTEVAERIKSNVRDVETVARIGGDEFVVLIEEIGVTREGASQKVALIAEKIRMALSDVYHIKGHKYHSSPSIGISLFWGYKESVEDLLKHADLAMYQAKNSGRNTVRFFDPALQLAVEARALLEADLRHALVAQQFHLYYQLQVDNQNRPFGAEALIRWMHPQRGMVSPAEFIPVAEDSMLIVSIGHWVLEQACRQLHQWSQNELTRSLSLAINVSAHQFCMNDFVETVSAALKSYQVEPSNLKLELTEGVVLSDVNEVIKKMHALKVLGVGLSLDDFGTGYSSLAYLKQLPLDQIKIDQSFVRDITTNNNNAMMVQTIIDLASNFQLNVIAEGVETEAQLSFLKHHGCMAYQGYYFSKPLPIDEVEQLLTISS